MNPRPLTAALGVLAVLTLAACNSSSLAAASSTIDRSDPRAVSDAFARAWGAGDYATACGLTADPQLSKLTKRNQCSGQAAWSPQTPRVVRSCTENGALEVIYQVDQQVDRFFIFTTGVTRQANGTWAVDSLMENDHGETLLACRTPQPSGTA